MASQLGVVTGNKRLRPNQLADLNARLAYLPQMLSTESQENFQEEQIKNMKASNELDQQRYGLESSSAAFQQKATKKGMDLKERSEEIATGIGGAGLGFNIMSSPGLKGSLGESVNKFGSSLGMGEPVKTGSFWNEITVGASLAGGLMGFGASRLAPKNKFLRFGVGAGVGALSGFFGGGGAGDSAAGGILGGIGGLL